MTLTCRVCEKENPKFIFHCEDHYFCADCETRSDLITDTDAVLCNPCRDKRIEKQIASFDGDTYYEDDVTCPHCGHKHSDSWEMDGGKYDCSHCENEFELSIYTTVSYSTSKV